MDRVFTPSPFYFRRLLLILSHHTDKRVGDIVGWYWQDRSPFGKLYSSFLLSLTTSFSSSFDFRLRPFFLYDYYGCNVPTRLQILLCQIYSLSRVPDRATIHIYTFLSVRKLQTLNGWVVRPTRTLSLPSVRHRRHRRRVLSNSVSPLPCPYRNPLSSWQHRHHQWSHVQTISVYL